MQTLANLPLAHPQPLQSRSQTNLVSHYMSTQDPFMFSGSVRHNLDPFKQHTDDALWGSLDQVGLKGTITAMDGKLDTKVVDAGGNFSLVSYTFWW